MKAIRELLYKEYQPLLDIINYMDALKIRFNITDNAIYLDGSRYELTGDFKPDYIKNKLIAIICLEISRMEEKIDELQDIIDKGEIIDEIY